MIRAEAPRRKVLIQWALGLVTGFCVASFGFRAALPAIAPEGAELAPPAGVGMLPGSMAALQALRVETSMAVFGQSHLPRGLPVTVQAVPAPFPEAAGAQRLAVESAGQRSEQLLLQAGHRRLAVYHAGHDQDPLRDAQEPIRALLRAGFDVLAISMPPEPHSRLQALPRPLQPFLEPVAVGLNHALAGGQYDDVVMLGLSGGGWTTVVYSALDPRIRRSYPVAGSLPMALRGPKDVGDFEQALPGLPVDYPTLYLMASTEGRQQLQVFNRLDPCCFAGVAALGYAPAIARQAQALGGRFGVLVVEHDVHEVPPALLLLARGF